MIDNIKIKLENVSISDDRTGYRLFGRTSKIYVNVKYIELDNNKRCLLDDEDEEEGLEIYKRSDKHRIKITLVDYIEKKYSTLYIEGSIRKWFYGIDSTQDLTRKEYVNCIDKLACEIGIDDKSLWNAKVTKLETGVTIKLKDKHRGIINCIWDYKNFQKNSFGQFGVEFKGKNYDVIFYDQIRKIYNRREKKERQYKKLSKNNFFLRYEIQGHKVSGMSMFNGKVDTLLKLRNNWDYIGENLLKTLDIVTFVKVISPETFVKVKNGEKKQMTKFLVFKGIQNIGLENFRTILSQMKSRKKSEFKTDFIKVYEDFEQMDTEYYKPLFRKKVEKRILKLK